MQSVVFDRRFIATFGVDYQVCEELWTYIDESDLDNVLPRDLLIALNFLKTYSTETTARVLFKLEEKTIREKRWLIVEFLSSLNLIDINMRHVNRITCPKMSLDGVDFRIVEPSPFDKDFFSHKFKHAALRYEIGLSLNSSVILWYNGGVKAGAWSDLKLAKSEVVEKLDIGEKIYADKGYRDGNVHFETYIANPEDANQIEYNRRLHVILARHEHINKRMKQFECLNQQFKHGKNIHDRIDKHKSCFAACINILQIQLRYKPFFDLDF